MSYLFDTNALLDIIRRGRDVILGQYILDLTIYEIGNVIWKEVVLFKSLKKDEAKLLLEHLNNIIAKMNVIRISAEDTAEILEISTNKRITFYDAAYLYFAKKRNLILVTNDQKLYNTAKSLVKVLRSNEI
ncbi:MAG: type II toxin-antitoxin system VapC family toxin [Candidatus Njordarchaeales archaeon]